MELGHGTHALTDADWARLDALRAGYLEGEALPWHDERDLALYHRSFGERIAWKWRAVLGEAPVRALPPIGGTVVDFGCGSGVASLALLGSGLVTDDAEWVPLDHSPLAWSFAQARLAERGARVRASAEVPEGEIGTLVASHVLTELEPGGYDALVAMARRARRVVVVEPGSKVAARELVRLREDLVDVLAPVAPCPHAGACGLASSHALKLVPPLRAAGARGLHVVVLARLLRPARRRPARLADELPRARPRRRTLDRSPR
ncbi:MAG: small ribosomal subunit Rsm22 family protein [Planctomycetota bacterium]